MAVISFLSTSPSPVTSPGLRVSSVSVKGQETPHRVFSDCEPNANVEALRVSLDERAIEARPLWKPMHKQPVYKDAPAYVNGVSESLFKVGMCLPSGPYVTDDDVRYIVDCIKEAIELK